MTSNDVNRANLLVDDENTYKNIVTKMQEAAVAKRLAKTAYPEELFSYADTPFTTEILLIKMPRKFSFPNIQMYDGTSNLNSLVAHYR